MRPTARTESTSTRDFLTYGNAGIELARANERRANDLAGAEALPSLSRLLPARRWLGSHLIALGRHVAGAPAPAPAAAE